MAGRMSGELEMARPEPRDIRASDTERQRVVATLQSACVEGRLDLDEYGQRVEAALTARTRAQLDALLIDLPAEMGDASLAEASGAQTRLRWTQTRPRGAAAGPSGGRAAGISNTVAILGSAQRSGFWRLAEESRVVTVLGSCRIDLRSARISAAVTTLRVASVLGSIDVIVPTGVEVELEVHAVLGSRDLRMGPAPPAGAPLIRITGMVLLGSLNVRDAAAYEAHIDAYG
jgi:hypothetical protein